MIGHQLNGYTVLLAAPDGRQSWALLAQANEPVGYTTGDKYVVSSVNVSQLPAPDNWGQGHYYATLHQAVEDYQARIFGNPEAQLLELALRDLREHLDAEPDLTEGGEFSIVEVRTRASCMVDETWRLRIHKPTVPDFADQIVEAVEAERANPFEGDPEILGWLENDTSGITVIGVKDEVDCEENRVFRSAEVIA